MNEIQQDGPSSSSSELFRLGEHQSINTNAPPLNAQAEESSANHEPNAPAARYDPRFMLNRQSTRRRDLTTPCVNERSCSEPISTEKVYSRH
jgi:hypothetical protein